MDEWLPDDAEPACAEDAVVVLVLQELSEVVEFDDAPAELLAELREVPVPTVVAGAVAAVCWPRAR